MPDKVDKIAINNVKLDRRVKLTQEQREQIKREWVPLTPSDGTPWSGARTGSIHSLAAKYGVSRRTISSIVRDKPIPQVKYADKKHYNSSSREYRRKYTQKHRNYKRQLYTDGKIG